MQFITTLAALLSVAVAAPTGTVAPSFEDTPPNNTVTIQGVSFAGSGCPAGTVANQLSSDLSTITLLYDSFVAQAGSGITPSEYRKNCQLNVKLRYPQGWQFSIFKADYRGYANVPKGATGTCKATYYFSGQSSQISSTTTLKGPWDNNYLKTDQFGFETTVWSPCGQEGLLNINSEVRLTPLDSVTPALMTVDSTDLKFTQIHYLQWQKC